jgi:hypothetical protein
MTRLRLLPLLLVLTTAALLAGPANASELIDRDAKDVRLQVNAQGEALLSYTKKDTGKQMNVLVWGAVNAIPPSKTTPQVAFKLDYAGGWGKYKRVVHKSFVNVCKPYTGPALAWFITACTAPDGSHWAVQSWQRGLPDYGVTPTKTTQTAWELRLSHWTGDLPVLTVHAGWAYKKFDYIFGSFTYQGTGVFGFAHTPRGVPLDTHGRNLYVDTLDSAYGPGWMRENSFLMHEPNGQFCYGFYPHAPHPIGAGSRYRATIIGPGVTPDVMWEGVPLGPYDAARKDEIAALKAQFIAGDPDCKAT